MTNFAPVPAIDGPPREPLSYGLFSTFTFRPPTAAERWENGVEWEALSCDVADVLEPDCETPPHNTYGTCLRGGAPGFIVTAGQKTGIPGGRADLRTEEQAVARLLATEEVAAERHIWLTLADDASVNLVGADLPDSLALAEEFMGDYYGSRGTVHMSRRAASLLSYGNTLHTAGARLLTVLDTPIAAGGGYGMAAPKINEIQKILITGNPTGGSYTVTYAGQTTTMSKGDGASDLRMNLEALSNIAPGDVIVTGDEAVGFTVEFTGTLAGTNVAQMTTVSSLTGGTTPAVTVTTIRSGATPVAEPLRLFVTPPVFGYRGAVQTVSLIDPHLNDAYSLAQRGYTIGWDPCPIASITIAPA